MLSDVFENYTPRASTLGVFLETLFNCARSSCSESAFTDFKFMCLTTVCATVRTTLFNTTSHKAMVRYNNLTKVPSPYYVYSTFLMIIKSRMCPPK